VDPKEYEQAVLERFRLDWPAPAFEVRHDIRLAGKKTRIDRQIDVAVFEAGHATPFLLVEAKKHRRSINAGIAGSTIALVQDVGGIPTVMVSTSGFSVAAINHLTAEAIGHLTITLAEAQSVRWIPVLEERFAVDSAFKLVSGALVEALRRGDLGPFHDADIAYEEWLAVIDTGLSLFPSQTVGILQGLASLHADDGYRFNAIQILIDLDMLDAKQSRTLLLTEIDAEVASLLQEHLAMIGGEASSKGDTDHP
jgi:hypothetical protein